jgi:UDP-N-acetyl-D-glucosamine dehydrogenase
MPDPTKEKPVAVDAVLPHWPAPAGVKRVDDLDEAVASADLVILIQNHREYDPDALAKRAHRFFDTRGVTTVEKSLRL